MVHLGFVRLNELEQLFPLFGQSFVVSVQGFFAFVRDDFHLSLVLELQIYLFLIVLSLALSLRLHAVASSKVTLYSTCWLGFRTCL